MALIEDVLASPISKIVAVGVTALVLPRVLPELPPGLRSVVRSGLKLLAEAESDAEGGFIDKLVAGAVQDLLASLSDAASDEERQRITASAMHRFQETAHRRARRYGHDEGDRQARYDRHTARLKHALSKAQHGRSQWDQDVLAHMAGQIGTA